MVPNRAKHHKSANSETHLILSAFCLVGLIMYDKVLLSE